MEWETNSSSAMQEIPCILWNPKFHYYIHKCLPPVTVLSQISQLCPHPTTWRAILIISSHLCLGFPTGHFPSGFPNPICTSPLPKMCHVLRPGVQMISSSLCWLLHFSFTLSLFCPSMSLSTSFSDPLSLCSSHSETHQVSCPYKQECHCSPRVLVMSLLCYLGDLMELGFGGRGERQQGEQLAVLLSVISWSSGLLSFTFAVSFMSGVSHWRTLGLNVFIWVCFCKDLKSDYNNNNIY